MPFREADPDTDVGPRYNTTPPDQPAPEPPSGSDIFGAAMRQGNSVVSLYSDQTRHAFPPIEGYSPADDVGPTDPYFAQRDKFVASASPAETIAIKSQIAQEEKDKRIFAAAGTAGTIASIGAGISDPLNWFVPGGMEIRGASTALHVAAGFAAQTAMQETALHASQRTRSLGESAENVASATLLGGILGGASSVLSRKEFESLASRMDKDRAATARHASGAPNAFESTVADGEGKLAQTGTPPLQTAYDALKAEQGGVSTVWIGDLAARAGMPVDDVKEILQGAAQRGEATLHPSTVAEATLSADRRAGGIPGAEGEPALTTVAFKPQSLSGGATDKFSMDALTKGAADQDLKLAPALGLEKVSTDPKMSLMNSPLQTARRFAAEFGEMPLETTGNLEGKTTTAAGGASTETLMKLHLRTFENGVMSDLRDAYKDLRWNGQKAPWWAEFKDQMSFLGRPADMPTYEDFTKMVSEAQMHGDQHDIPQVAEGARKLTARREEWAQRAEAAGLLVRRTDEPYLTHDWNKKLFREQRPEVADHLAGIFAREQDIKRGIQTKLKGLSDRLAETKETIARLGRQGERSEGGEAKLDAAHIEAASIRTQIEEYVGKWSGKSSKEAKVAIKGRTEYEATRAAKAAERGESAPAGRSKGADAEVDAAVERILKSETDLDADAIRSRAHDTIDHILGSPDGRIYNEGGGVPGASDDGRGSQNRRTLNMSNAEAFPWINQNAEAVNRRWGKTMIPDTLIAERYDDVDMKGVLRGMLDEHAALSDAARGDTKAIQKLDAAKDSAIAKFNFMREKARGLYGRPANESEKQIARVIGVAKNLNVLTSLGMSGVNSITDAGAVMMKFGLTKTFGSGFFPYVRSLMTGGELNKEVLRQAKAAGISIDWNLAARHHGLADMIDDHADGSMFERTLQAGASKMQLVNLQAPWTDRIKATVLQIAAPEMKAGMEAMLAGTANLRQTRLLAAANINEGLAKKILVQYEEHGVEIDGVHLPNVADWKDIKAKEAFQGALIREADNAVVTPGIGDAGIWMSQPILGLLGQFKQFTAAAHTRILVSGLQRRDAQTLGGLVGAIGMGMLSYKIGSMTGGSPTSDNPSDWIKEGISRSSALGWLEESNAFASKMTRGQLDMYRLTGSNHMMTRYQGRSVADQVFGPTIGKLEKLSQVTGAAASGGWKASDTHAGRQLIAYQNTVWLRGVLNQVEHWFNSHLGIEEKQQ